MDQVSQIKEKIDIVTLIGEYIPLKKAGRNFSANCPFHKEKTPSFMVSPERQTWHCFGCQKSGDAYAFLMEYERLDFPEALRILAKQAGIELAKRDNNSPIASQKEHIFQLNSLAKEFYHYILTKHPAGKRALAYLEERRISAKIIQTFFLGFAPASGNALVRYLLQKKKYTKEELLAAGLAYQGDRQLIDFFRGRLIFPLIDYRDNTLGFAGRVMSGDSVSKYINTRETAVYHKGDHVYGLNVTKDAIRREDHVIIVEGEFDVLSCFEHGVGNVVAVKGTALTEQQVNLLSRYTKKIAFCFDDDSAGRDAIKRSLSIVEKKDLIPTVIVIPNGKDPDESLQKEEGIFKKAVKDAMGVYDYLFMRTFESVDIESAEGKQQVTNELLPFIIQIQNEIVKEHYLRKLSSEIGISYESILKESQRYLSKQTKAPDIVIPKVKQSKEESMEQYLLALITQSDYQKDLLMPAMEILSDVMPKERANQKIFLKLVEYLNKEQFNNKVFENSLDASLSQSYNIASLYPLPEFQDKDKIRLEVEKTSRKLKQLYIQDKMKQVASVIRQKVHEGNGNEVIKLEETYTKLVSKLE